MGPGGMCCGHGPFGNGGNRGWGSWGSSGAWTSGPWTAWWGQNGGGPGWCPDSTWSGWTSGSWSTGAPWTSWKGCTCYTTATSTVVSTSEGHTVTSVTYEYQVAEATAALSGGAVASATGNTAPRRKTGAMGSLVVAGLAAAGLF